jgi:undecaprenyl-diphosphatase
VFYAILLGIIQGLTEFLPVSSSGHLVLIQSLIPGFDMPPMVFDIMLHAGTLAAVIAYFHRDLFGIILGTINMKNLFGFSAMPCAEARWLMAGIILGSIPAGIAGVLWGDSIENAFSSPLMTSLFLVLTAVILVIGEYFHLLYLRTGSTNENAGSILRWILMGIAQMFALLPGVSRSGTTISAGIASGWSRPLAARLSFLLMIPAVGGAVAIKLPEVWAEWQHPASALLPMVIGSLVAAITGFAAIHWMLNYVRKYSYHVFAVYCGCAGCLGLVLFSYMQN